MRYCQKIIVIDSAEKLLDLDNIDPFKEFISALVDDKWKIIFTTRDNYLGDLNYQFLEIHKLAPLNINIRILDSKELQKIAAEHSFSLPKDEKLIELIKNPFYLNEYLKFYDSENELDYCSFKNSLWNNNIKKSKPKREQCFLKMALDRANTGQFFIDPGCETDTLDNELTKDGILGYEAAGYFITHDIYEEWALERIIESEFLKRSGVQSFLQKIGQSLPVRRSFRSWMSEKLLLNNEEIKGFIDDLICDQEVESFWKNETLISVLLSDYSEFFFDTFKEELLSGEQHLLRKISFLIRIACKVIDDDIFKGIGIQPSTWLSLKFVFTKPKGQGWNALIQFVFNNLKEIGIGNINFILPIIHDWNKNFKEGKTTKLASLIALQYYQWLIKEDVYFSQDNMKKELLQTILNGSFEIKNELKVIFEEIINNKWKNHTPCATF